MKAYSLDFRCVVINAYESGEGTVEDVAEQFRVGTAFVKKMLRLHRAGESLEPKHGDGAQAKLTAAARAELRAAAATRPDATLAELQEGKRLMDGVLPSEREKREKRETTTARWSLSFYLYKEEGVCKS